MQEPILVELPPGEYWICSCGQSTKLPYCDGSHRRLGLDEVANKPKPHKLRVTPITGAVWLCACAASRTKPFCDGSHNKII